MISFRHLPGRPSQGGSTSQPEQETEVLKAEGIPPQARTLGGTPHLRHVPRTTQI